ISNTDDGDPLFVLYEWWRGGRRIWRSELSELPAELHSKGDTIVVSVTASDGLRFERRVVGTTIVDTPLSITLPITEYAVSPGEKVNFQPTFYDPDGDPFGPAENLRLLIDYGPLGMAIDADTGLVTWTA